MQTGQVKNIFYDFKKKYSFDFFCIILLLVIACLNILFCLRFGNPFRGDSQSYIDATQVIAQGIDQDFSSTIASRMLKPLPIIGIGLIAKIFNIDYYQAFFLENIFFYFLTSVLIYYFLRFFFKNNIFILLGSIFYISAYPMLRDGIAMLTESGAHFFYILSCFLVCLFYKTPSFKYFFWTSLSIIIGFHWKEYSAVAGLFFFLVIISHPLLSIKSKIIFLSNYILFSLLIIVGWQFFVYHFFRYTYFDWIKNGIAVPFYWTRIYYTLKSLFGVFILGWFLTLFGFLKREKFLTQKFLKYLLVACCLVFVWSGTDSRLYYVIALPGVVYLSTGLMYIDYFYGRKFLYYLFVIALFSNYSWFLVNNDLRSFLDFLPYAS